MNIKNIQPPECPEDPAYKAQYAKVYQLVANATPEQKALITEMIEFCEGMQADGCSDDEIAQNLLNKYGD
jgi:hypothetical protein